MKFDFIFMNPPFNDGTSSVKGSKTKRMTKKLHLDFFNQTSIDTSANGKNLVICPATKWWVGGQTEKSRAHYVNAGMKKAINADDSPEAQRKGLVFAKAKIKNIGIFLVEKGNKKLERDDFNNALPKPRFPLTSAFKFYGNAGVGKEATRAMFESKMKKTGTFKIWATVSKNGYTNNPDFFKDRSRGHWRVVFNHNNGIGKMGQIGIARPTDFLSYSVGCFEVASYEEACSLREFLTTNKSVKTVFEKLKKSPTNSKYIFSHINGAQFIKEGTLC